MRGADDHFSGRLIDGQISFRGGSGCLSDAPSEIECEVIRLFDQFRDSLLRYALSFGLVGA